MEFSEKSFYLNEFRGRTLAFALPGAALARVPLEKVLDELAANRTRAVLLGGDAGALALLAPRVLEDGSEGLEGATWRTLRLVPRAGIAVRGDAACRDVAVRLGVSKLVWLDPEGGLGDGAGARQSFLDVGELRALLERPPAGLSEARLARLREIERTLDAGVPAVNLCTANGLADELFTYAGSGSLFTRERYVVTRPLGIDDFDAAADLIARGVAEGYLAPRTDAEVDRVLAHGFGCFVEGRHLAGIGALLPLAAERAGEIASLYTLTRFLGEGIGAHLVRFALERARDRGDACVFACTTAERAALFFERHGFRRVAPEAVPASKWERYDPERRRRVLCLRSELPRR